MYGEGRDGVVLSGQGKGEEKEKKGGSGCCRAIYGKSWSSCKRANTNLFALKFLRERRFIPIVSEQVSLGIVYFMMDSFGSKKIC